MKDCLMVTACVGGNSIFLFLSSGTTDYMQPVIKYCPALNADAKMF